MKIITLILLLILITGCASLPRDESTLAPAIDGWSSTPRLAEAKQAVIFLHSQANQTHPQWQQINAVLYFLRSYSYLGEPDKLSERLRTKLANSLQRLANKAKETDSAEYYRFMEHYAVSIYRLLDTPALHPKASSWISTLTDFIAMQPDTTTIHADYALWESYRALAFLAFSARTEAPLQHTLVRSPSTLTVLSDALSRSQWQQQHALWVLGYWHQLSPLPQQHALDAAIWRAVQQSTDDENEQQRLFSTVYLVNSFRGLSYCKEGFQARCASPNIDDVLPINHRCSERLFIRATSLNSEQLQYSCRRLIAQEQDFHELFASDYTPVANDHNHALRVVIFDNYSDYNRYGQLLFDIQTNNGGMYIEGTPSDPQNQATFYSFRAFWLADTKRVWNLNHEYVHYLDGRYNKYGGFGHFAEHLVWWSEGLAELIAKAQHNPRAIEVIKDTDANERPSLQAIFATDYSDSSEQIYQWSYLAMRYLQQHDIDALRSLQRHLSGDFYQGYTRTLTHIAKQHQPHFARFVNALAATEPKRQPSETKNRLYRYLYRDYLMPSHLSYDAHHRHLL